MNICRMKRQCGSSKFNFWRINYSNLRIWMIVYWRYFRNHNNPRVWLKVCWSKISSNSSNMNSFTFSKNNKAKWVQVKVFMKAMSIWLFRNNTRIWNRCLKRQVVFNVRNARRHSRQNYFSYMFRRIHVR